MTLQAFGGDGLTGAHRIEIVPRPRIEAFGGEIEFPKYMGREPAAVAADATDVAVPGGARIRFSGRADKELRSAVLVVGEAGDRRLDLTVNGREFAGAFEPDETALVEVELRDVDDLDTEQPPRLLVRVVPDQAPRAQFIVREVGSMLTPHALVPGELDLTDDFGLREPKLQYKLSGVVDENGEQVTEDGDWTDAEILGLDGFSVGATEFKDRVGFDLRVLNPNDDFDAEANRMRPGQFLSLRFSVEDNFGPGEPHRGESDVLTFRLVTREELIEDLARRQSEAKRELRQAHVEAQAARVELGEILSPTDPGQSVEDRRAARLRLAALARAQRARARIVGGVATRYRLILSEYEHNRLLEPNKVADLRGRIPAPLEALEQEEFPPSAEAVSAFAETGTDAARKAATDSYDRILARIAAVLAEMDEVEDFGQLVEHLRRVIELQDDAMRGAAKKRRATLDELFGPDNGGKSGGDDRDK